MKEINLVPENRRSPAQGDRVALIKKHRHVLATVIEEEYSERSVALSDMVVLVMDEPFKNALWPNLPGPPSSDISACYIMVGPREGFREYVEAAFPDPDAAQMYAKIDEPAPPEHVYVLVAAYGGLTLTALGSFVLTNTLAPNSPNN